MILTIAQAGRSFTRTSIPAQRGLAADVLESKRARLLMLCWTAAGLDLERAGAQMELPLEEKESQ